MCYSRPAKPAVALAHQIFPRTQPVVLHEPVIDDPRKILNVRRCGVEQFLGLGFGHGCPAESRPDRIDEHEVGEIQPRAWIVHRNRGVRRTVALVAHLQMLGSESAEVQIDGRSARSAVQGECDRTVFALHCVGGQNHLAGYLAVLVAYGKRAHGDRILERLAVQLHRLLHMRIWRQRGHRRLVVRGRFFRGRSLVGGRRFSVGLRPSERGRKGKATQSAHDRRERSQGGVNPEGPHLDTIQRGRAALARPPPHGLTSEMA